MKRKYAASPTVRKLTYFSVGGVTVNDLQPQPQVQGQGQGQSQSQGQGQVPTSQGQSQQRGGGNGPTADVGTLVGALAVGGPSGARTQSSGIGAILANDPSAFQSNGNGNLNGNGVQSAGSNPNLGGSAIEQQQQGGSGVSLSLADPNFGQPNSAVNGQSDLGGLGGTGITIPL